MNKIKSSWEVFKTQDPHFKKQTSTPKEITVPSFEENFKIFLRVKPIIPHNNRSESIKILNNKQIEVAPPIYSTQPDRIFQYEEVFTQSATNQLVFQKTMQQPISNVLSGYNSTVFIYGMTGAGKTFTMFNQLHETTLPDIGINHNEGIVGLSVSRLFEQIRHDEACKYQVILSFFEIYNENIKDLLCDSTQSLSIMQDPIRGVFINDLKEICVQNPTQTRMLIQQCLAKRSNNATKNNEYSSRSHAILQFTIKKYIPQEKTNEVALMESKLFLIDLAGNEKAGQNESKRFVEGVNINKSLLTLGKCINILSEQRKPAFIPFRDSKLTRILKDSLGGNSKTVMIACISAESKFYEETLNTLKYSSKARKIKNKGKGANIKLINKKNVPKDIVHSRPDDQGQPEEKIYVLINHLQSRLEEKIKIEKMREQLEDCYFQNQKELNHSNSEIYSINMQEINEIFPKLNSKYSLIEHSIDEEIKKFIAESNKFYKQEINCYKATIKQQNLELEQLRRLVGDTLLIQTQYKRPTISSQSNFGCSISQNIVLEPQATNKLSPPTISSKICNNHILIHESNRKSDGSKKKHLDLATSKNMGNKQNMFFLNDIKRSNTPQSSMASSKIQAHFSRIDSQKTKHDKQKPTINISMENIKLKSPSFKFDTCGQDNSEERHIFLQRLQDMDKNMHNFKGQQMRVMIDEYEQNHYELNKTQTSMINKLKFIVKTNERQTPLPQRDKLKKNRSLIK